LKEKINECLKLQDELNKKIDTNWKNIRTREDFFRAIWLECAESVESLPWIYKILKLNLLTYFILYYHWFLWRETRI